MSFRTLEVKLVANVSSYTSQMGVAARSTKDFAAQLSDSQHKNRADLDKLSRGALVMGGALAVGFAKGIQVSAGFEKQMSGVQAVSGATAKEMDRLSDAALEAGASTKLAGVTAGDAAAAEGELVKAGVSVSDVLGGALMGSLTLAAAGQIDFANAATIAAQAMNIFDLAGRDVTHIADVLAAAANKSASDVGGLGDALRQGGLVAAQTGLDLEETVATLAAFADNALIGSDAGTSLKTMLQRLTPVSKEAKDLMDKLGFSAYDAHGQFVGIEGLAQRLQVALSGMTDEQRNLTLATLFGSDAVRGANVLYEQGAAGMRDYKAAVEDEGAAARMAAIQNDNLSGDVEALGGAFESALIENGSKANEALRFLTQTATGLVTSFSDMPDIMQTGAFAIGAVVTAGTLAVGVLGTLGPKVTAAKDTLEAMGGVGPKIANNIGKITGALGVLGAGLAVVTAFEAVMGKAEQAGQDWADSLAPKVWDFSTYDQLVDKIHTIDDAENDLVSKANDANMPWDADYRKEMLAGAEGVGQYGTALSNLRGIAQDLAPQLGVSKDAMVTFLLAQKDAGTDFLTDDFEGLKAAMLDAYGAMPAVGSGLADVDAQLGETEESTKAAEAAFKSLMDAYRGAVDPLFGMLDAIDGNRAAQKKLAEAYAANKDAIADNNVSNEELAALNRDVASSALDVESAAMDLAHAIDNGTVSVDEAKGMLADWVEQGLITEAQAADVAEQFGVAAAKADEFAGEYVATIAMETADAYAQIDRLARYLNAAFPDDGIHISVGGGGGVPLAEGGPVYLASGGLSGPKGTDTVPAWLTPGEFVIKRSAAEFLGAPLLHRLNRADRAPVHMAGGGPVRGVAGWAGGTVLVEIDYDQLAAAMARRPVNIELDGRMVGSSSTVIEGMDSARSVRAYR